MTAVATTRELELADALSAVRSRLAHAAEAAGRNADEIELLPITKFFPATDVAYFDAVWDVAAFGESREQEASNKAAEVSTVLGAEPIRWHMVGRIQRNKARSIAGWAYAAHSVDSAKVIAALDRAAAGRWPRAAGPSRCGSTSRSASTAMSRGVGWTSAARIRSTSCVPPSQAAEGLEFVGLMAIPPLDADPDGGLRAAGRRAGAGADVPTRSRSACRRGCPVTSRSP